MNYAKNVHEDAKILALMPIMPETLLGEASVFRARTFNLCVDVRTAIVDDLGDKVPLSTLIEGQAISTTNKVQSLTTGEQAMFQQFRKGEGKWQRAKESKEHAGIVVRAITTAETARRRHRATAG